MDQDEARHYIRESWRDIMQFMTSEARDSANGETSYVCPLCGHGENGDGLTYNPKSEDGNSLHCFGCNFSGDIFDLIQKTNGVNFSGAMEIATNILGITIDDTAETVTKPGESDCLEYYKACQAKLTAPAAVTYLKGRGISVETARKYGIGYDPVADPAKSGHNTPRLIIPITEMHYIGRSIESSTPKKYQKMNNRGGVVGIFNADALNDDKNETVFVVEGVFDALSVIEAGESAIALDSISNVDKLIELLEQKPTRATLVLSLDNDINLKTKNNVKRAEQTIIDGLNRLNISYVTANISGNYKDPNEHMAKDKTSFVKAVKNAISQTTAKPDNVTTYIEGLMWDEIDRFHKAANRKTGYINLDELSGGLYPGLYALAAISSLGKTTFAHQMADQLAAAGHDVIFFSLEQSRLELVSKSLARMAAKIDAKTTITSLSIRKGEYGPVVGEAAERYKNEIADRLSIIEGNFNCDCEFIADYTRRYIQRTGTRPVVFVDYLQILQPEASINGKTQTTKEVVDNTITMLKRMSRELDLTIIVISSVNRANYMQPIDFESLKESGSIEYSCDVVYGLQLRCLNRDDIFGQKEHIKEKRDTIREEKAKNPRKIELVCLKNRYGISSFSCAFDYYPAHDLFVPIRHETPSDEEPQIKPTRKNRF